MKKKRKATSIAGRYDTNKPAFSPFDGVTLWLGHPHRRGKI